MSERDRSQPRSGAEAPGISAADDIQVEQRWRPYDRPRIRHITGIRIHQLTLPESLSLACKFTQPDDRFPEDPPSPLTPGPDQGESSSRPSVPSNSLPLQRTLGHPRQRSSSASTARPSVISDREREPPSPTVSIHHTLPRTRVTRPRAPTLAGEALEHGATTGPTHGLPNNDRHHDHAHPHSHDEGPGKMPRRPLRCFVTLKLSKEVDRRSSVDAKEERRRTRSDERDLRRTTNGPSRPAISRTASSTPSSPASMHSSPSRPRPIRPALSSSSSSSSLHHIEPRTRTVSLTTPDRAASSTAFPRRSSATSPTLSRTSSRVSQEDKGVRSPPRINGLLSKKSMPSLSISHHFANGHLSPTQPTSTKSEQPDANEQALKEEEEDQVGVEVETKAEEPVVPFYVSPIQGPTTHPRFLGLEEGDFAPWLTDCERAIDEFELEIWVEDPLSCLGWVKLPDVGGKVCLWDLRRGLSKDINGLEFTLSHDTKEVYHVPVIAGDGKNSDEKMAGKGVVERSLRETRMKKGAGVGGVHQLVNLQAVVSDTQRSSEQVRRKIDRLLCHDTDRRSLRRELRERESKVQWVRDKIAEVDKTTRETQARITLKEQSIEARRGHLSQAEVVDELRRGMAKDLEDEIASVESENLSLLPTIHQLRAHHAQVLDVLFPIQPLEPSQLLYTILSIPLPIPVGNKDPAPPLSLPEFKVDEKSTAAALGYVAMLVQILGNLGGVTGGLPYTITCAGSRSAVRDGTGIMQGPRSFPLYAKGVERFRYEYAVFLLNKNIEMLMQETNIRLLDIRHTLPNLKNLLLTLSSPSSPSSHLKHGHLGGLGARPSLGLGSYRSGTPTLLNPSPFSGGWSRASSAAYPVDSRMRSTSTSRSGDSPIKVKVKGQGAQLPSPLKTRPRRSVLAGRDRGDGESDSATEDEAEGDADSVLESI